MSTQKSDLLTEYFSVLQRHFGLQHWWPGETPDEVLVGCVLAQNTKWERVVPVIEGMRMHDLLSPAKFTMLKSSELVELLKGSGTYKRKAGYLMNLGRFFMHHGWNGSPASISHLDTLKLRKELLSLRGIGPETCDCILLYVLRRPVFVIDAYTRRILSRHGICRAKATYGELQHIFHESLKHEESLFNEYHALLVACAREYCRPEPQCRRCPLNGIGK